MFALFTEKLEYLSENLDSAFNISVTLAVSLDKSLIISNIKPFLFLSINAVYMYFIDSLYFSLLLISLINRLLLSKLKPIFFKNVKGFFWAA